MDLITIEVEKSISKIIADKFSLVIDDWSKNSTHFLGIFASFLNNNKPKTVLLSFTPLLLESNLNAQSHLVLLFLF